MDDLLSAAGALKPRHRDALIHGLLDAADVLEEAQRRRVVGRGLQTAQASVRRTALDRLCELDGPEQERKNVRPGDAPPQGKPLALWQHLLEAIE